METKPQLLRVSTPLHLTLDPSPQVEGRKDKGVETHRETGLEAGEIINRQLKLDGKRQACGHSLRSLKLSMNNSS
ncbi:MAG: hypothetical protein LBV32_01570 [Tannerellaceae bacterium]|jgi:hypothetical protein|nr:hypothetical protein [Tannerellaceae bacterium]